MKIESLMEDWRKWARNLLKKGEKQSFVPLEKEKNRLRSEFGEDPERITTADLLNAPLEKLQSFAAPPRDRPALVIDPIDPQNPEEALHKLDNNIMNLINSEDENRSDQLELLTLVVSDRSYEIDRLSHAETISAGRARALKQKLADFKYILAHLPTIDEKIMHHRPELSEPSKD